MTYVQEAVDLATHYPYSYGVCEYVYLSHGDKAEEILKVGSEKHIPGYWIMKLSDVCLQYWALNPPNNESATDPILRNLRVFKSKEEKLPRRLKRGW